MKGGIDMNGNCFGTRKENKMDYEGSECDGMKCPYFATCEARREVMDSATPVDWDALEHHCIAHGLA